MKIKSYKEHRFGVITRLAVLAGMVALFSLGVGKIFGVTPAAVVFGVLTGATVLAFVVIFLFFRHDNGHYE